MEKNWGFAWLGRFILAAFALIFTLISLRFIPDPVRAAAASGVTLSSPMGVAIARIGFGAFPLGCAAYAIMCLVSTQRLLAGLTFVSTMVSVVLAVRILGIAVDHTVGGASVPLAAEILLLALSVFGLSAEMARRRRSLADAA